MALGLYVLPLGGALHVVAQLVMAVAVVLTLVTAREYLVVAWRLARGTA